MEEMAKASPREDFKLIYGAIKRPGADKLLAWLENNGFFEAPASAGHHGNHPGGLAAHSVNVWRRLREITVRDALKGGPGDLWPEVEETVAVMGLLHDVCKVDVYHKTNIFEYALDNTKNPYTYRDPFPLGHGEKSVYLIMRHMALTEEEALAIRWHMGAYDYAAKGGDKALDAAMDRTPWVWRLHEADMCASRIDERGAAE